MEDMMTNIPTDRPLSAGDLHAIARDASERVHKNGGCAPQLAYAPILWALQDARFCQESERDAGLANDIAAILDENADADESGLHNASQLAEKVRQYLRTRPATSAASDEGVGEAWHRDDNDAATLLYTLKQQGWLAGRPVMVNDLMVRVERHGGGNREAVVSRILAALTAREEAPAEGAGDDAQWLLDNYGAGHPRIQRIESALRARTSEPAREASAYRVRLVKDDPDEWTLMHPEAALDFMDRSGWETQPLYTHPAPATADKQRTEAAQALRSLQEEVERLRVLVGDMQPMAICWATHYATGRGFERHPTHANILDRARSALNTGSGEG